MTEGVREVVPEPVLGVVDEREKQGGHECGRDAHEGAENHETQVGTRRHLRVGSQGEPHTLSRILRSMSISKWFRREKRSEDELREEEESRLRAAEEARRAEQDSERSRLQSKVPSNPGTGGGLGGS